ncbi:MAG: ferrochelatase [Turneriella sp.]
MRNQKNRAAVLLVNLGSPNSPSVGDVRNYLAQFLMDGYVIDIPYAIRWMIVHLFILPFRPKRSAEAYGKIWTAEGSPLLINTKRFAEKVQKFSKHKIYWAMRYGHPSIASVLTLMRDAGHTDILVAPLYPHHALSSTVTAIEEAKLHAADLGLTLSFLPAFYDSKAYQVALAKEVKKVAASHDYVLFSYHGLPVRHITKSDPTGAHCMKVENCCAVNAISENGVDPHKTCYRHQVIETTNAVAKLAGVKPGKFGLSFQSRLGRAEWLKPMTSEFIAELPKKGIRKIALIAPAFVADNLETLEEANMQLRDIFLSAGGEKFTYIPCLNDDTDWAKGFAQLLGSN